VDDICARIRRITNDLNALHDELEWQKLESSSHDDQAKLLEEILSFGLVTDFKAAVDRMRHFVWCYIESVAAGRQQNTDYALQSHRLRRVTEMLRMLSHNGTPEIASLPEAHTFFEHVTAVVDQYKLAEVDASAIKVKGKAA
jgi:hypothetical protein